MTLFDPPDLIEPEHRRSWDVAVRKVWGNGDLDALTWNALGLAVRAFHAYVDAVAACGDGPPSKEAAEYREVARDFAADFMLLSDRRRLLGTAGAGRVDADLAAIYDWTPPHD